MRSFRQVRATCGCCLLGAAASYAAVQGGSDETLPSAGAQAEEMAAERVPSVPPEIQLLSWADEVVSGASSTNINLKIRSMGQSTVTVAPRATVRYRVIGELSDDNNEGLALIGFDLHFEGGPLQQADEPAGEPTEGCENPMIYFDEPWGITNPAGFGGTPINGDLVQCGGGQNTINNTADNADFPIGPVLTGVAQPSGCGPAIILTGQLTAPQALGTYHFMISNVFANVIKQGETGEVFFATEAAGVGSLVNLTVIVGRTGGLPFISGPEADVK